MLKINPFKRTTTVSKWDRSLPVVTPKIRNSFLIFIKFSFQFCSIVCYQKLTEAARSNRITRHICRLRPYPSLREHGSLFPTRRSTHHADTDDFYRLSQKYRGHQISLTLNRNHFLQRHCHLRASRFPRNRPKTIRQTNDLTSYIYLVVFFLS